jgi:preprotein translocase subunit YajC
MIKAKLKPNFGLTFFLIFSFLQKKKKKKKKKKKNCMWRKEKALNEGDIWFKS